MKITEEEFSFFVHAVITAESSWRVDAVSSAGAFGLMQLMPTTADEIAAELGVSTHDLLDPDLNRCLGAGYLRRLLHRFGDLRLALAAYNCGPTRVSRLINDAKQSACLCGCWLEVDHYAALEATLPAETRSYVNRVMGVYNGLRGKMAEPEFGTEDSKA